MVSFKKESWIKILSPAPSLTNIEITKKFNYELRSNGVFSRNNLPIIKDGSHVINLDDKQCKGKHWISLFIDRHMAMYFDSFGTEYIPQEVLNKIKDQTHDLHYIKNTRR